MTLLLILVKFQKLLGPLNSRATIYWMTLIGCILHGLLKLIFSLTIILKIEDTNIYLEDKQHILTITFCSSAITSLVCGRLSEVIGPRKTVAYSTVFFAIAAFLIPLLSDNVVLAFRGFLQEAIPSSVMPLAVKWFPLHEQAKFLSVMEAVPLGVSLARILIGTPIFNFDLIGVYSIVASLAILWSMFWFFLVYDSPSEHPEISIQEREEIEIDHLKIGVPKQKLFCNKAVWVIMVCHTAMLSSRLTLFNVLPFYMRSVHQFDFRGNLMLLSIGSFFTSTLSGHLSEELLINKKLSALHVRKIFVSVTLLLPGLLLLLESFYGENIEVSITVFTLVLSLYGAHTSGHLVNILDVAPNYPSTVIGVAKTLSYISSFFAGSVISLLLQDENNNTFNQWRCLFWFLAFTNISRCVIYLNFAAVRLKNVT